MKTKTTKKRVVTTDIEVEMFITVPEHDFEKFIDALDELCYKFAGKEYQFVFS